MKALRRKDNKEWVTSIDVVNRREAQIMTGDWPHRVYDIEKSVDDIKRWYDGIHGDIDLSDYELVDIEIICKQDNV